MIDNTTLHMTWINRIGYIQLWMWLFDDIGLCTRIDLKCEAQGMATPRCSWIPLKLHHSQPILKTKWNPSLIYHQIKMLRAKDNTNVTKLVLDAIFILEMSTNNGIKQTDGHEKWIKSKYWMYYYSDECIIIDVKLPCWLEMSVHCIQLFTHTLWFLITTQL